MATKRKQEHRSKNKSTEVPPPTPCARVLANSPMSGFKHRLADRRTLDQRLGRTEGDHRGGGHSAPASPLHVPRPRRRLR